MPSMPEPASATAIGTPSNERTNQHGQRKGGGHVVFQQPRRSWLARRFFPEQIGPAAADAREVDEHDHRQRQEARAERGCRRGPTSSGSALSVVSSLSPRHACWVVAYEDDRAEQQRHADGRNRLATQLQRRRTGGRPGTSRG